MENKGTNNMRKLLQTIGAAAALLTLSMVTNAAEVPPYPRPVAPPVYVPPPFSWTGFYLGANLGGAWGQRNLTDTLLGLTLSNVNDKGAFIGGGQLGFNYQFGNFVLGVEGDFDGVGTTNSPGTGVVGPAFGTIQVTSNNRWITTLAGRFGVTNDTWLFYGKAGGGWVGYDNLTITNTVTGARITGFGNNTNNGWLVGAGIEWALAPNWSVKIEYDYLGLSSQTFTAPTGTFLAGDTFTTSKPNVQMVKVGANYLFKYWVGGY
jgi:outer membrane immunogenic protein